MNDMRESLTRKLGPLPVWVWALVGGIAVYMYRSRKAGTGGVANVLDTTSPGVSAGNAGAGTGGDPVTLGPGESVYDPNTGQVMGGAPEQTAPADPQAPPTPLDPVVVPPGQGVYDPNTGKWIQNNPPGKKKPPAKTKPPRKTRSGKNTNKAKPKHRGKVPAPGSGTKHKTRVRSVAKILSPARSKSRGGGGAKGKVRGTPAGGVAAPPARVRAKAAAITAPAIRQRPAAPVAVNHAAQRVAPHPAPAAAARPAPAARPPSRPAPAPPRARGRKR